MEQVIYATVGRRLSKCCPKQTLITKLINHVNSQTIDSNVMDWANITEIHTHLSAKCFFPLTSIRCKNLRQFCNLARNAF